MKKKYYVNFKFVELSPNFITYTNPITGAYNLTLNEMLQRGGTVIYLGAVQVEAVPNGIFSAAKFKGTQQLNNALLTGQIVQNPRKSTYFVMTNVREMQGKANFDSQWDWA